MASMIAKGLDESDLALKEYLNPEMIKEDVVNINVMKKAGVAGAVMGLAVATSAGTVNLVQSAELRDGGTYTYFARGDAQENPITPFTVPFFPGGQKNDDGTSEGLHASSGSGLAGRDNVHEDRGDNARPIPFARGELTDGVTTSGVYGYIDTLSPEQIIKGREIAGYFDVLIDLGKVCEVDTVNVYQQDTRGLRWRDFGNAPEAQEVWTAEALADPMQPTDSDFALFAKGTFPKDSEGYVTFESGKPVRARYVVLHVACGTVLNPSPSAGIVGGRLSEIEVMGKPVE